MRTFNSLGIYAANMRNIAPFLPAFNQRGPGVRNWGKQSGSFAELNRRTGQPHTHAREIARRLRQQANMK